MKIILSIWFVSCFLQLFSQDDDPTYYQLIKPKHAYSLTFGLPISVANKPFKGVMQGLVRFSTAYQFSLKNGISFGLGGNYTYFNVNRFKTTPQIFGGYHLANGFVKLGYEKYISERIGFEYGINIGGAYNQFYSNLIAGKTAVISSIIEPNIAFCLTADHKSAFKWNVSYSFLGFGYSPEKIGDLNNIDFPISEYNRITCFFSFGFSYSHFFKQW